MATSVFKINTWGGLNVLASAEEVGASGAIALANVDLFPGGFQTRPGYSFVNSVASTIAPRSVAWFPSSASGDFLVATTNTATTTPYLISTGVAGTTVGIAATSENSYAVRQVAGANVIYLASLAGGAYSFDGTAWTLRATIPTGDTLAMTPLSDRLAVAASSGSRVSFSDAGAPTTFTASSWVDLAPTDGSGITALVPWRDQLFAFKQTKFFTFGGEGTDSSGNPIFSYRPVDVRHGCTIGGAVAGHEGVYFADATGIYLTAGDAPRYISRPLEPWLNGSGTFSRLPTSPLLSGARMAYFAERLYVTGGGTTLVYDPKLDAWTIWQVGATGFATDGSSLWFGNTASKKLAHVTGTTDNGSSILTSYITGQYQPAGGNAAVVQEVSVLGTGTATVALDSDLFSTQGATATLGTSPVIAEGWPSPLDQEGTWLQATLFTSGVMMITELRHHLSFIRGTSNAR